MEQMEYNLLFCWFVGLSANDPVWHPTVFTKNRDRLLEGAVAEEFFSQIVRQARSIRRARKTSPAGNVRDCAQPVNSLRCSSVSETNSRYPAIAHRRIHPNRSDNMTETFH